MRDYARMLESSLQRHDDGQSADDINAALTRSASGKGAGALLSSEFDTSSACAVAVRFAEKWHSHEEARRWALDVLRERVTFAADGSQLLPGREISLPTAAVQIGSFENPHRAGGQYLKEARLIVISPRELLEGYGEAQWTADAVVSYRRFEEETRALSGFIERHKGWRARGERVPVGFFDGTLLISYARPRTRLQDKYIEAILKLVRHSRAAEVPVIGYIDQSYARDIINLINALYKINSARNANNGEATETERTTSLYDAQVLRAEGADGELLLSTWGDRTKLFLCVREGLGEDFRDEADRPLVSFVYLQTTSDGAPARLDVPTWIYDANLLEAVIDAVRAECVVGNGYPYPIETADATAVITMRDRERFLRAMQEFAERENFAFNFARKSTSKTRRR